MDNDVKSIVGPEIVTVTIYRNWGRPSQTQEVIIRRMDELKAYEFTNNGLSAPDDDNKSMYQITVVKI